MRPQVIGAPAGSLGRLLCMFLILLTNNATAEIRLTDDSGRTVTLAQPAKRIITLAPHIVELLYAAGAGERIVGAVEYSYFPEAAKSIPRIGDSAQLDLERIVAMKPDLIIVWQHGNAQRQLDRLLSLGVPVYYNEPRSLDDIARSIEQLSLIHI
jgi:iron complex transport system substrate-binding protein